MQNPLRRPRNTGPVLPTDNRQRHKETRTKSDNNGEYLSKDWQAHFVAMSGEFVGTFFFLFFALSGTQVANTINPPGQSSASSVLYIALAFGFSLAVTAWVMYRISGGLFNPAVRNTFFLQSDGPVSG